MSTPAPGRAQTRLLQQRRTPLSLAALLCLQDETVVAIEVDKTEADRSIRIAKLYRVLEHAEALLRIAGGRVRVRDTEQVAKLD
jgi:hypothetical protein